MKNLKFYIEIVGGKIKFYNNRINDYIIKDIDFPFLDYLFEKGNVFIGISASMNLHKSINIKDFVVKEVVPNLKGVLKLFLQVWHSQLANPQSIFSNLVLPQYGHFPIFSFAAI